MSRLIVTPAEHAAESWRPVFRCCWCNAEFEQRFVIDRKAWVCPNDECYERQFKWHMVDKAGGLFYLPMPKQVMLEEAVASGDYAGICMGGARGGGKSTGFRPLAYRYCKQFENFTVLILRRTFPELKRNHIQKAIREAKRLEAKLTNTMITFPETDSTIEFGHCHEDDDWKQYIGYECDLLMIDQLEDFIEIQFTEIGGAVGRISRDGWRGCGVYGENPGGPLSDFVDKFFISKKMPVEKYPDYDPTQYHFIYSELEDNPNVDKRYVHQLSTMKAEKREMYRWGRRDIFPGQFFKGFKIEGRLQTLVVPKELPRLGGLHWAFQKPGLQLWAVPLPDGRLYIECEWEFTETDPIELAVDLIDITETSKWKMLHTFSNPPTDVPDGQIGEDPFQVLNKAGWPVVRSRHHPVSGWQRVQQWMRPIRDQDGNFVPALIINPEGCPILASALPKLLQDSGDTEDIADAEYLHAAKALRYIVMARPAAPLAKLVSTIRERDTSNFDQKTRRDIERLARHEASTRRENITETDPSFPWGDMNAVAKPDEPW